MLVRRAALKNVISYTEESCRGCLERRILAGIEEGLSGKAAGSFSPATIATTWAQSPASPMFNFETLSSGALRKPSGAHKPRVAKGWRAPARHPGATDRQSCVRPRSAHPAQCPETSMPPAASSPPSAGRLYPVTPHSARNPGRRNCRALVQQVVVSPAAPAARCHRSSARIRQVIPAQVAMNTHFSHISCIMYFAETRSKRAPAERLAMASARAVSVNHRARRRPDVKLVEVSDAAAGLKRAGNHAQSAQNMCRAKALDRAHPVPHPVQQRQDHRLSAHGGRKRVDRALQVIGLATEQDQVEGWCGDFPPEPSADCGIVHIAHGALNLPDPSLPTPQPAADAPERSHPAWPPAICRQISADGSGSDHENAHLFHSLREIMTLYDRPDSVDANIQPCSSRRARETAGPAETAMATPTKSSSGMRIPGSRLTSGTMSEAAT